MKKPKSASPEACAENIVTNIFLDFCEDGGPDLGKYLRHVGLDVSGIPANASGRLVLELFKDHYRRDNGTLDVDRACQDLATFPPIAQAIVQGLRDRAVEISK